MNKKVTVHVLSFNHEKFLGYCIESIKKQSYKNVEIIISDNNSTDDSVQFVKKNFPEIRLEVNKINLGYAAGHNKAIKNTVGKFFMPINADVVMTQTFIEEKVKAIETDKIVGMVEGKLIKVDEDFSQFKLLKKRERFIDSTGLILCKNRKNYERGSGQKDEGQFEDIEYIFGAFGASAMYRREMLEDIKIEEEYFDEKFFMYREEVDLAWRAQLFGWKCVYTPNAVAYHVHAYNPNTRKNQPKKYRLLQFRNRYLMIVKNDTFKNFAYHLPYILSYEILALGFVLLREPYLLKGYYEFIKLLPDALKKRKTIMNKKKVSDEYIRNLFNIPIANRF